VRTCGPWRPHANTSTCVFVARGWRVPQHWGQKPGGALGLQVCGVLACPSHAAPRPHNHTRPHRHHTPACPPTHCPTAAASEGLPQLTFAELEDALRDPVENELTKELITAVRSAFAVVKCWLAWLAVRSIALRPSLSPIRPASSDPLPRRLPVPDACVRACVRACMHACAAA
jgi:hypothetical protein